MTRHCTISFEELTDYTEGRCTPAELERLNRHLGSGCSVCREQLAFLAESLPALSTALAPVETPIPDSARAYARNLARLRSPDAASQPSLLRWIATLVSESGRALAPTGVRGAEAASVQRLYETEAHLITLWEERSPAAAGSYVIGQVYERQQSACLVPESVLFTSLEGRTQRAQQEGGEFYVAGLAPGTYLIQCWLDGSEVLLPRVPIGEA